MIKCTDHGDERSLGIGHALIGASIIACLLNTSLDPSSCPFSGMGKGIGHGLCQD